MTELTESVARRLKDASGREGFSEDPAEIAPYLTEWRGRWKGRTPLLLKPDSTEAVARVLKICNETETKIVAQGGNTGLVGGQIPTRGEVLLSLERLNRIRSVSAEDNALVAEAGVTLRHAQDAADGIGRLFPLSLASEGSCTIGGNVSTNAGVVHVLHYGMMRDLVLGLEVVLAGGCVLDLMRGLRKDNTGYDLKQLFIGAEGTLGVVTAATLKLFPKPSGYVTALVALADVTIAVDLLNRLQMATGGLVTAYELMQREGLDLVLKHIPGTADPFPQHRGWSVLVELSNSSAFDATEALEEALATAASEGLVVDALFAKNARDRAALWRLRETIPEAQRQEGASIANDISVPLSKIPGFLASANRAVRAACAFARPFAFGHAGDGNLHFAIVAPDHDAELKAARGLLERVVQDEVHRLNGSISAEHGLGLAKNETIARYKSAAEIEAMRALKRAFDPKGILNPGKLLPPE